MLSFSLDRCWLLFRTFFRDRFWDGFSMDFTSILDSFLGVFSCFFQQPSRRALLASKTIFNVKNLDFLTPSDFQGCQNGPSNFHFLSKSRLFRLSSSARAPPGADPAPSDPSKPSRITFFKILTFFFVDFERF